MHVTSLEIILAVVAVFVVFGPKELPRRHNKTTAVKVPQKERAPYAYQQRVPARYAAGRAPSPLKLRAAETPVHLNTEPPQRERPQFATGDSDAAPLPHELLRV
jgi:hypothetical protein